MLENAFVNRPEPPSDEELTAALGGSRALWDRMVRELGEVHGTDAGTWGSSSAKLGWSLRVRRGKRIIVYLSPGAGRFMASFALGDRAVRAAGDSALPDWVLDLIAGARRYAEGTAVRIEVASPEEVEAVLGVAAIKVAH